MTIWKRRIMKKKVTLYDMIKRGIDNLYKDMDDKLYEAYQDYVKAYLKWKFLDILPLYITMTTLIDDLSNYEKMKKTIHYLIDIYKNYDNRNT